jgi:glycosyltransferase involved in cell wall biosynthesis
VAFLVNGDANSAVAIRARGLAAPLDRQYDIKISYRTHNKQTSILRFLTFLHDTKPGITYVFDMAYSGVIAGLCYKFVCGNRLIVDTGDSIYALAQSVGTRSKLGLWLTWLLEWCSLRFADEIVVRGTVHKQRLRTKGIRAEVIQDGVESETFRPMDVDDLRRHYGLIGVTTVGLVGSITWSPRLQMCYGSELIDTLCLLRDLPVKGIVIGDGSGLDILKTRARELGIDDRILFLGRIPYGNLPKYLNLIDICLSTQTNDEVGEVRTTGKLPLYLASGKYILASRVGEAALLLPETMLVDYENTKDTRYAYRLAQKIRAAHAESEILHDNPISRSLAVQHFEYSLLARRLSAVLASHTGV